MPSQIDLPSLGWEKFYDGGKPIPNGVKNSILGVWFDDCVVESEIFRYNDGSPKTDGNCKATRIKI